ncbi:cupin domain-containing protein [Pseudooceanicola sp. C21-150M6]|uniref:cupin domain-containing protein n=1 Tax=Pseudooceanicola sp. C21-150M6 TaxID=3434355 RepID=UPI003D7FD39E
MKRVNLDEKLAMFSSHWDPHVVAQYNGNDVMVVKFQGDFPFHHHADTDDFFLILEGEVVLDGEGGDSVTLGVGDLCVVPKGMEHRPRAVAEAKVLLIEPAGEPNTGDPATAAKKPHI